MLGAYQQPPPYQRNDYIGWIARAKRADTRQKRLAQMIDELARGDQYMNMAHGRALESTDAKKTPRNSGAFRFYF